MTESENVERLVNAIKHEWDVYREVEGMSALSGKRKMIDLIIRSKTEHNGKRLMFGVECKRPDLTSFNHYSRWFKQMVVYTQCMWGNKGVSIPVLAYPKPEPFGESENQAFDRIMGAFGIGYIECVTYKTDYGSGHENWRICMSATPIWSTFYGYNNGMVNVDFSKKIEL